MGTGILTTGEDGPIPNGGSGRATQRSQLFQVWSSVERMSIMDSSSLGYDVAAWIHDLATWILEALDILAWPLVVTILMCLVFCSEGGRKLLGTITGSIRKVSAMGFALELSDEGGQRLKINLEEEFGNFREQVNAEFNRQIDAIDAERIFHMVAEQVITPAMREFHEKSGNSSDAGFRCTVYVQDIVFNDVLYRLFDYYPKGEGQGRTYSVRYGIIGKVWRSRSSECKANVTGERQRLIEEWGMTEKEAVGQDARAYFAIVLRTGPAAPPTAILFIDTEAANAEDADQRAQRICLELADDEHVKELTNAIDQVMRRLRGQGPRLDLVSG